jgi:hypothetical protein
VFSLETRKSILSLSTLFLSFPPSSGYISKMPTSATRWIWQSMPAVPTLCQLNAVTKLSILYIYLWWKACGYALFTQCLIYLHNGPKMGLKYKNNFNTFKTNDLEKLEKRDSFVSIGFESAIKK